MALTVMAWTLAGCELQDATMTRSSPEVSTATGDTVTTTPGAGAVDKSILPPGESKRQDCPAWFSHMSCTSYCPGARFDTVTVMLLVDDTDDCST